MKLSPAAVLLIQSGLLVAIVSTAFVLGAQAKTIEYHSQKIEQNEKFQRYVRESLTAIKTALKIETVNEGE